MPSSVILRPVLTPAEFPLSYKLPMVTFGALLVPAMTYYNRFLLQTILVPLGVSIGITAISWIVKWVFNTSLLLSAIYCCAQLDLRQRLRVKYPGACEQLHARVDTWNTHTHTHTLHTCFSSTCPLSSTFHPVQVYARSSVFPSSALFRPSHFAGRYLWRRRHRLLHSSHQTELLHYPFPLARSHGRRHRLSSAMRQQSGWGQNHFFLYEFV